VTIDSVIVFDLDDTLYLERDYAASGFAAVSQWLARELGESRFEQCALRAFTAGVRGTVFNAALEKLGITSAPALIEQLVGVYRAHRPVITLAEDAGCFLDNCPQHLGLALLTDGYLIAQERKIEALGLADKRMDPIVCTDRWGRADWKPSCRGFLFIQERYGLPASKFTYVADNPAKDFVGPRQLGWRTVQISRPGGLHRHLPTAAGGEPDHQIESLDELAKVL